MGNLTTLIPTRNRDKWNIDDIYKLLSENFENFNFERDDQWDQLTVTVKNPGGRFRDFICNIYFNRSADFDFESDIQELKEIGKYKDAIKLELLVKSKPDMNNVIETTYGDYGDYKNDIDFFLKDYFGAYIFDEGIHPEYIPPDYVRKPKKKIKRFFNF